MAETPLSDDALSSWPLFHSAVYSRLGTGRKQYGDSSFTRPLPEIIDELAQELLDQAGWAFVGWVRLRKLADTLARIEAQSRNADSLPAVQPTHEDVGRVEAAMP